ncbi:L-cystine transporter [Diaporthe sp. PMI_573]|nr:L-cystine transporter [Diaporthaceae sp. PMI_573]
MASTSVQVISGLLGWSYMLCWASSFYPQPILNIRRKTTLGFSIDFAFLNILGMASYAIYNIALYSWPTVRHEYAGRYPSHPEPTVQLNDIVYASHGAILAAIIYSQFYPALWRFTPIKGLRLSRPDSMSWSWLDVIFVLGNVKSFLTLVKYALQAVLNLQRKSTVGMSILQFSLDLTGGILSLAQLFLDSASAGDWSAVSSNPCQVCARQHHRSLRSCLLLPAHGPVLYRGSRKASSTGREDGETDPLLADRGIGPQESVEAGGQLIREDGKAER